VFSLLAYSFATLIGSPLLTDISFSGSLVFNQTYSSSLFSLLSSIIFFLGCDFSVSITNK